MRLVGFLALGTILLLSRPARAQQFNSDSYLSKQHGMATLILTYGDRNDIFMNTFSLLPRWEFTAAVYIYNTDDNPKTDDGYSTSLYAKYMFYENKAKTGGFAMKAGTGMDPGYLGTYGLKDAFKTYWTNAPATIPLFDNKLSWDIMPGASITMDYGTRDVTAAAFTYSTRLAYYPTSPTWSIVGEVFGAEGGVTSIPEYKVGPRWEPNQHVVLALTYGQEFNGSNGAGWEVGAMLFSPPFLCLGGCDKQ
ncbi:MAG TPA: hypothetical protein VL857_13550 [Candidatus Eisenbacteria bacterium]|nr:hypothetical protein [Candidatus Eisenbacteria bacterium]